jgi:hypothetical protein
VPRRLVRDAGRPPSTAHVDVATGRAFGTFVFYLYPVLVDSFRCTAQDLARYRLESESMWLRSLRKDRSKVLVVTHPWSD